MKIILKMAWEHNFSNRPYLDVWIWLQDPKYRKRLKNRNQSWMHWNFLVSVVIFWVFQFIVHFFLWTSATFLSVVCLDDDFQTRLLSRIMFDVFKRKYSVSFGLKNWETTTTTTTATTTWMTPSWFDVVFAFSS